MRHSIAALGTVPFFSRAQLALVVEMECGSRTLMILAFCVPAAAGILLLFFRNADERSPGEFGVEAFPVDWTGAQNTPNCLFV